MTDVQESRKDYMPTLDGVRAVACLLVLVSHVIHMNANGAEGLYVLSAQFGTAGVELFFALSGFLIGSLYIRQDFSGRNVGHYTIARIARIVPCYYIALTVAFILSVLIPGFQYTMDPVTLAWSYGFFRSIHIFWTVPPEIQFYAFFLLLWAGYEGLRRGHYIWPIAAIFIALFIVTQRALWPGIVITQLLHIFLAGVACSLALLHPKVKAISAHPLFQMSAITLFVIGISALPVPDEAYANIPFGIATAIMVMALSHTTRMTFLLKVPALRFIGAASFSIYLFHDMMLQLCKALGLFEGHALPMLIVMQVAIALGLPLLFHAIIERNVNKGLRGFLTRLFDSVMKTKK